MVQPVTTRRGNLDGRRAKEIQSITDRERFELSIPGSPVCRFSRPVPSTTRPPVLQPATYWAQCASSTLCGRKLHAPMRTKKIFEKCSAFLRENPRPNLGTVIKPRVAKEITNRSGHAGLVIPCTEYHSTHTSQNQSARAHCARLEGHVQRAVVQSPAVKLRRRFTYREDFCVRCGILV